MKKITTIILSAFLLSATACASDNNPFTGEITGIKLVTNYDDFKAEHESYELAQADVALIKNIDKPLDIHVLFGTWCHDSAREVPRYLKLLAKASNKNINTKLIGVDYKKTADEKYDLKYTPTFIVYSDGVEIGRIIERPKASIAQDLANIVSQ